MIDITSDLVLESVIINELNYSKSTLYRLRKNGLSYFKIKGRIYYDLTQLKDQLRNSVNYY